MPRLLPLSRHSLLLAPLVLVLAATLSLVETRRDPGGGQHELDPVARAAPAALPIDPFTSAERARQRGDLEEAIRTYRSLLQSGDAAMVDEARVRLAGLLLGVGRHADAAEVADRLETSSSPVSRDRASFLHAEIARARDDCADAEAHYQQYLGTGGLLAPYARFGLIDCAERAGDARSAAAHAQAVLDAAPHRRLRIEALERLAAADLRRGNVPRYLAIYDELYQLGSTRAYKGTVLMAAAEVARNAGDRAGTVDRLARLVRELPEHPRAADALDALNSMQGADAITWTQAGLVRLQARDYQAALDGFDVALQEAPNGAEASTARYNRAVAILRLGKELEAAREMRAMAARYPASSIAPIALLRAGRIVESNDLLDEAAAMYTELVNGYPATNQGRNGRFRLGLIRYLRGDVVGASGAWDALARDGAERDLQSLALLWQGKAAQLAGNDAEATARWQRAVEIGPDTFSGLRAASLLAGNALAQHEFRIYAPPTDPPAGEPELNTWLSQHGGSRDALDSQLNQDPAWQRAVELIRLGLREYATWELDALAGQASQSAAATYHLAELQVTNGFTSLGLRTAEAAARDLAVPRTDLPVAFQRLLFPLGFDGLLLGSAQRFQVDAMLMAALVRQESRFDPQARSGANAVGLSQVVPGTGRQIAAALGRAEFAESDLLSPATNLDFGAYYLKRQLDRYDGLTLPALAAYNAGAGAVDRWLGEFGRADMDLFAERIPYTETNHYLHVVYENAALYRRLYE